MKYIKAKFNTKIEPYKIFLYIILGFFLSLTINSIFIEFGLIKLSVVEVATTDKIYYYIALVIRILLSCVIGPFIEELIFRGYIYELISKRLNKTLSILLTTIIFSAAHFSVVQSLFALLSGFVFILLYTKTNNLLVSFLIHSTCNITAMFVMFVNTNIIFIIIYLLITITIFLICYNLENNNKNIIQNTTK